ncbi:MAG TPA: carbamoyltransferase N-terminal domain-containing protein, partial [Burkholderiaceae bacterium]|nr:carbamoyltransferase N-terminal domain-containing protein [Burkholderiaceae bacterium]
MITLGINAAFHDCSAALVRDGEVIAAAEEERFTRVKHGKRPVPFAAYQLPFHAIDYCLRFAGLHMLDVDRIGYAFDPRLLPLAAKLDTTGRPASGYTDIMTLATERLAEEDASGLPPLPESIVLPLEPSRAAPSLGDASPWDPLFLSYVVNAPRQLVGAVPHHLQERFAGLTYEQVAARWHWVEHHRAHEASAFLASPFDQCAVLTMDGRGERATTSLGWFTGEEYRRLRQVNLPHSLGLLYEDVTRWLGFQHASDEYKVMALAAFGAPEYVDIFREHVHATDDGAYVAQRFELTSAFGPARRRGDAMEQHHLDVARSLQQVLEDTV